MKNFSFKDNFWFIALLAYFAVFIWFLLCCTSPSHAAAEEEREFIVEQLCNEERE